MRLSDRRASLVRTVKLALAGLVMLTFLFWMANVKTSFFTARIPVRNRSGLTLRSVGSSGILLPVLCVQGWCVAYRRVRIEYLLLLRRGWCIFGTLGVPWSPCAYGEVLALLVFPLMSTILGLWRCAYHWTRALGEGRWGHSLRDSRGVSWVAQKCARFFFQDGGSGPICVVPYVLALGMLVG